MPKLTLYPDGAKMARAPGFNPKPSKRGETKGWTSAVARRNRNFLMSVNPLALHGKPFALTLTIRDIPPSHEEWERLRNMLFHRLKRMGLVRWHWVTEFQKRGAPHFHALAYFHNKIHDDKNIRLGILYHWSVITQSLASSDRCQHVEKVDHLAGWKMYLAKHASRGAEHYQRSEVLPTGWTKVGRMWGKSGEWPVESEEFEISWEVFCRLRRIQRNYMAAQALKALRKAQERQEAPDKANAVRNAKNALVRVRRRLKTNSKQSGQLRGSSDWCDPVITRRILDSLRGHGYVRSWDDREISPNRATQIAL